MTLADLQHATGNLGDVRLHYVTAGLGSPRRDAVVLLHGWPQSWHEWRHILPALAAQHPVVAIDLRGLGDSSKPAGGFDKMTLAGDVARLLAQLGLTRVSVVGHDWGGAVAAALAFRERELVSRLALLDIVLPGIAIPGVPADALSRYWHMHFHQVSDLPEALVSGREALYISWFFNNFSFNPAAISQQDVAEYARCLKQPGALRCGFGYYRAMAEDAIAFADAAREPLACPVLALGGAQSMAEMVLHCARQFASEVSGGAIDQCGHWIPEERPDELLEQLLPWLEGASG